MNFKYTWLKAMHKIIYIIIEYNKLFIKRYTKITGPDSIRRYANAKKKYSIDSDPDYRLLFM